jgi:multidrug efflux pump subunit AcrB
MSRFAIRFPYFIIVVCLLVTVIGSTALLRMPVDLFPPINLPVVVVATFYSGMPAEQIEANITSRYERFFTLAGGVDHIESRSITGVSVIRVYFQPDIDPDIAASNISNLAMANLRRLPQGTLPPIVLKFDASSLPVCLVTISSASQTERDIRDLAQYVIRSQLATVPGASIPQPFGGAGRRIMIYADPSRLEAYQMSIMDLVRGVNDANLVLPAGNVKIGPFDYNILSNSQLDSIEEIAQLPVKVRATGLVRVGDIGQPSDAQAIQTNIVRVDGERSVYLPILKQGGNSNTISIVEGVREGIRNLLDVPDDLNAKVVFDQSEFVKTAIETLLHEGGLGLFLTSLLILVFLGSLRATVAVFFSIPISVLATFMMLQFSGGTVNTMVLGGLALAFSRLIDNSVVVLENIYRHLEMGKPAAQAAEEGGREVALPVLAATLTTAIVFFPVTFLFGVSKFLFSALAAAVVLSLFASYFVALTVVPLYCSRFIKSAAHEGGFNSWFNQQFERFLQAFAGLSQRTLNRPGLWVAGFLAASLLLTGLFYAQLNMSFFPRTDPGEFTMNIKAPTGTRVEIGNTLFERVEQIVKEEIPSEELDLIVSNIGNYADISAIYTPNTGPHTGFTQVALKKGHRESTFVYMDRVRLRLEREMPELQAFFRTGGLVESVINMGMAAAINVQVSGSNLERSYEFASQLAAAIRELPNVSSVYIPQDLDYPALRLQVDRTRAAELGLSEREVVQNVITALTSNQMIAPSYWVDPQSGRDYFLTVQYPERQIKSLADLKAIPLRGTGLAIPTRLDAVSRIETIKTPTSIEHYQIRRVIDVYVQTATEDLSRTANAVGQMLATAKLPPGVRVDLRGSVQSMRQSFTSFGQGLLLALVLLYLVLVAQFASFVDPLVILLAVPPGLAGVMLTLHATGTSLNIMSLMGLIMLMGISVSNSILIVEFTRHLREQGMDLREAVSQGAAVRLRPVLMTSLATIFGLLPMALNLGEGSEAYAPLARALLGGLALSVLITVFVVPAAYLIAHKHDGPIHERESVK